MSHILHTGVRFSQVNQGLAIVANLYVDDNAAPVTKSEQGN
jgi:hypothetical protein